MELCFFYVFTIVEVFFFFVLFCVFICYVDFCFLFSFPVQSFLNKRSLHSSIVRILPLIYVPARLDFYSFLLLVNLFLCQFSFLFLFLSSYFIIFFPRFTFTRNSHKPHISLLSSFFLCIFFSNITFFFFVSFHSYSFLTLPFTRSPYSIFHYLFYLFIFIYSHFISTFIPFTFFNSLTSLKASFIFFFTFPNLLYLY